MNNKKEITLEMQREDGTVFSASFNTRSGRMTTMLMEGKKVVEMRSQILDDHERQDIKSSADIGRMLRRDRLL